MKRQTAKKIYTSMLQYFLIQNKLCFTIYSSFTCIKYLQILILQLLFLTFHFKNNYQLRKSQKMVYSPVYPSFNFPRWHPVLQMQNNIKTRKLMLIHYSQLDYRPYSVFPSFKLSFICMYVLFYAVLSHRQIHINTSTIQIQSSSVNVKENPMLPL